METQKNIPLVDSYCAQCKYRVKMTGGAFDIASKSYWACYYLMITGERRGCPAGNGCTKKKIGLPFKINPYGIPVIMGAGPKKPKKKYSDYRKKADFLEGRQQKAIQELLDANQMTKSEMARKIGYSTNAVCCWYLEKRFADWELLARFGFERPDYCPTKQMVLDEIEMLRCENERQ